MGQLDKSELEALKLKSRRPKADRKRLEKVRSMLVRFLIVCEGTKTEPFYFKALVKDKGSEVAEVKEKDILGTGRATCVLVEEARKKREHLERKRGLRFDRVWVVFDKDDNDDFDAAVDLARKYGFECAWSNEAFELWYLLHFVYLDSAVNRRDYIRKLQAEVRKHAGYEEYEYEKNAVNTYAMLSEIGNEERAKQWAGRLRGRFTGGGFSTHCPATRVDLLVDELEHTEQVLARLKG